MLQEEQLIGPTPAASNPWIDFWISENIFRPVQWSKTADMFMRATEKIMDYKPHDMVLDVGCGRGDVELSLKNRVREIHAVDISSRYIDHCRERFKDCPHIRFYQLGENYLDFSFLGGKKFDKIICNSVIQYFRGLWEVEALIHEVRKIANPGARFLISDIPRKDSRVALLASFLMQSYQKRFLWEVLKFTWRARHSDYYKTFRSQGLLQVDREELLSMANSLGIKGKLLDVSLSLSTDRYHLLLEF